MCSICAKPAGDKANKTLLAAALSPWREISGHKKGGASFNLCKYPEKCAWFLPKPVIFRVGPSQGKTWRFHLVFESFLWVSPPLKVPFNNQQPIPAGLFSPGCPFSPDSCRCPSLNWIKPGLRMWWSGWISLVWFRQKAAGLAHLEIISRVGLWELGVTTRTLFWGESP